MPFRNSTFKDIQNPCPCNEKFHFFEYAGTTALYGYAALYEYAGTAAKAKSRGQEYPPIELDQALAFNKGASPHLLLRYQPLLQLRWANPRPAASESLLLDKRAISHLHRAEPCQLLFHPGYEAIPILVRLFSPGLFSQGDRSREGHVMHPCL